MKKVAIVDDVRANGLLLEGYMKSLPNLETATFTRPSEALLWCGANDPDLVLLDYMMPEMDGVEFLRRFRSVESLKDVPVVMVTGEESKEALYQALYSGATDFLRKPVDRIELVARARTMLELRSRQRALLAANEQLLTLATTDTLTGLRNRRSILELVQAEFDRSHRFRRPFSVAVIDVDHFKAVNDTHGHDVGDKVLQALAVACMEELREVDPIGRIGGEEFAILFPELPIAGAIAACERLLSTIRQTTIEAGGSDLTCTVSAGVTEGGRPDDTVIAIIKRADVALYAAKKSGRDRVEVSRDDGTADQAGSAATSHAPVALDHDRVRSYQSDA
jgi:diguanylate cyclase (GGDEF)-like protein